MKFHTLMLPIFPIIKLIKALITLITAKARKTGLSRTFQLETLEEVMAPKILKTVINSHNNSKATLVQSVSNSSSSRPRKTCLKERAREDSY